SPGAHPQARRIVHRPPRRGRRIRASGADTRVVIDQASPVRVLLVDDHELVRTGLRTMLAGDGGVVVVGDAGTGAAAIGQARDLKPDVVLLDARLPDMPGDEVCRRLLANSPELAVVILTTFAEDDLVRRCVRAGARGYLL